MTNNRETVKGFEVISLDGRDVVTLELNGRLYDMPAAVAKALAADLRAGVKRAEGK
jgi:hypothetical protein